MVGVGCTVIYEYCLPRKVYRGVPRRFCLDSGVEFEIRLRIRSFSLGPISPERRIASEKWKRKIQGDPSIVPGRFRSCQILPFEIHPFIDEPESSGGGKFEVSRSEIIGNRLTRRKDKNRGGEESLDIGRYWLDRSRRLRRRDRCKPRRVAARYSSRYDVINFAFYRVGSTINYSRGT